MLTHLTNLLYNAKLTDMETCYKCFRTEVIRSITIEEANEVSREALRLETARDVNNYLREKTRRILPEVIN